jgi:hypothetical protein
MKSIRHKFSAKATTVNEIRFSSKKEAAYYKNLLYLVQAGEVIFFLRQVPLDLGGGTKYLVDFLEFHSDGTVHFVDVKGFKTPTYILKKKIVEDRYPIEIEEK